MDRNELPKNKPVSKYSSCPRCGGLGHSASACTGRLPSATEMEERLRAKTAQIIATAPPDWVSDEFGLHLPSADEHQRATISSADFCFNCGRLGHLASACDQPSFDEILARMGDIGDRTASAVSERSDVANSLTADHNRSPL